MTTSRRILIVDDDEILRRTLKEQLSLHEDFEIVEAGDAAQAIVCARDGSFDAILLDVGLPDMDGRDFCRLLRKNRVSSPIIMLTAADSDADTILGLESGANDYVTKPFRLGVLLARLRAQLRQHDQSENAVFQIGPYQFQPAAKLLIDSEGRRRVRLTDKEAAILKFLYRAGNKPVGRDTLLHEVWGYKSSVTTHTLETHVYRLRQKMETEPAHAKLLVTEPGGYRLKAEYAAA